MSQSMTKPTEWMWAQRRLRSAWASAQSDQSLLCTQWIAKDPSFLQFWKMIMSRLMTKPIKWHVHPAKTQISLGICPVWSEALPSTWRNLGSLATHWAHSKESDQNGWMPRLIWIFAWRTCHFVDFVMRLLTCGSHYHAVIILQVFCKNP